jgi:site-specific DNA recombinase
MIDYKYDPMKPYGCVDYARMSDRHQNPRSPETQFANIDDIVARCGFPWTTLKRYRDDAISGRYFLRRPGLQLMLRDIEIGIVKPDLIRLDTFERVGRAEEIEMLRQMLKKKYGILMVTAKSNFADPTGAAGRAMGFCDQMLATEEGRTKAVMVMRGKRDAARQKRWPGGPPPFGFVLRSSKENGNG